MKTDCYYNRTVTSIYSYSVLVLMASLFLVPLNSGCSKSKGGNSGEQSAELSNRNSEASEDTGSETADQTTDDRTIMEKTGGMIKDVTGSGIEAANQAGVWIKEKVQGSYESGKDATIDAGNAIRNMFLRAKEQGTTSANNVIDFVNEDISKLGSWKYTSRTVDRKDPSEVIKILNEMGSAKWECFWVDQQPQHTILYFKKSPRSYVGSIPFKDLVRFLPEMGGEAGQ